LVSVVEDRGADRQSASNSTFPARSATYPMGYGLLPQEKLLIP